MGWLAKTFRVSFVGTISDDMYSQVSPLTASRKLTLADKDYRKFKLGVEREFGKISQPLFLYTMAKFRTPPKAIYKKYHRLAKQMILMRLVCIIFLLFLTNKMIDYILNIDSFSTLSLYFLCFLMSLMHLLTHSHKVKQIAVGCIFPPYLMFNPKNHLNFNLALYDIWGKKICEQKIVDNECYKKAVYALNED